MEFFLSFGHLRVSDGFVMLHKKGASGVLYSLNKGVLLILSRRGKINCQTDRAICSILRIFSDPAPDSHNGSRLRRSKLASSCSEVWLRPWLFIMQCFEIRNLQTHKTGLYLQGQYLNFAKIWQTTLRLLTTGDLEQCYFYE